MKIQKLLKKYHLHSSLLNYIRSSLMVGDK